jgi:hypothetical protein
MPAPFAGPTGEILATLRSIERQLAEVIARLGPAQPAPKTDHRHAYTMGGAGCVVCGAPASTQA